MHRRTFLSAVSAGLLAAPLAARSQEARKPSGRTNSIPVNTWTLVPALPEGTPPTKRAGKHLRVLWDSQRSRHVITAGDSFGSDAGQPAVRSFDATTGLSTILSPSCIPAPGLMPNWPDNVGWCHDTKRDKYLMFRGFYFWNQPGGQRPTAALTPSATTGTITLAQGGGSNRPFESWMVGKRVTQYNAEGGSKVIAHATITEVTSPTAVVATVGLAFANTNPIVSQAWAIEKIRGGRADSVCGRNFYAGDTGIMNGDCMYSPAENQWERPTWPESPVGVGNYSTGPTQAVYDEPSDSVYMLKSGAGMMILHRATDKWDVVPFGRGASSVNVYRSQLVIASQSVWAFSNRGKGAQAFIEYVIPSKSWHAYNVSGYEGTLDESEPQLVHDDVSNVLLHVRAENLTSDATHLHILNLATKALTVRPIPVIEGEPIKQGVTFWDPPTGSLGIFGRVAHGVSGNPCYHYRYAP